MILSKTPQASPSFMGCFKGSVCRWLLKFPVYQMLGGLRPKIKVKCESGTSDWKLKSTVGHPSSPPRWGWPTVFNFGWQYKQKICSRRWGSSLSGLRTLDPPLGPPSIWTEIFRCTCLQSHLQTCPPTHQKSYPKFWNPRKLLKIPPFSAQKCHSAGGRGGPRLFLLNGILILILLRSPCKNV